MACLYLFLASDLAKNITGQAVNVDRGEVWSDGRALEGRCAMVTGGASGIGRAIAVAFGAEGCHVTVLDRAAEDKLAATAAAIGAAGGDTTTRCVNVARESDIVEASRRLAKRAGSTSWSAVPAS